MELRKEQLWDLILVQNMPYTKIGTIFGVSSTAVKRAAIRLGIPVPRRRKVNEKEVFSRFGVRKNNKVFLPTDEEFANIIATSKTWTEIGNRLGYKSMPSSNTKELIEKRSISLGLNVDMSLRDDDRLLDKTKREVFLESQSWQSARSKIQRIARKTYFEYNPAPKCVICGYDKHVEVAHIKAVSEFSDNSTLREINSISNLIGLCPNHHWEYDNGLLDIK